MDRIQRADVVVVGSGVAGLTTALQSSTAAVALVTKTRLGGGSTEWAQGGIAAPFGPDDGPEAHAADTIEVGAGLNDAAAVRILTSGAVAGVEWLMDLGGSFDRRDGELILGREAGHDTHRVVHADGDATGAEVTRALTAAVRRADWIDVSEDTFVADLVKDGGRVCGVTVRGADGERWAILAPAVVLATGGSGRVYANTTNPPEVTGDGIAMAMRAGARVADLEFVQFHPTAIASGRDPMPLLTEALRGEGSTLVDDSGRRFMVEEHPDAELAPRDVVARAVWRRLAEGRKVFLDTRDAVGAAIATRFPTVHAICLRDGIDPVADPIPAAPAAHYSMGGVITDTVGRSSLPGLWAVGETSRTGVHGANRLASNSLVEGLVFGRRVAVDISSAGLEPVAGRLVPADPGLHPEVDPADALRLRHAMWDGVGVIRHRPAMAMALDEIDEIRNHLPPGASEARNLADVARGIATAALSRTESRGAHYRSDFPESDASWAHEAVFA